MNEILQINEIELIDFDVDSNQDNQILLNLDYRFNVNRFFLVKGRLRCRSE